MSFGAHIPNRFESMHLAMSCEHRETSSFCSNFLLAGLHSWSCSPCAQESVGPPGSGSGRFRVRSQNAMTTSGRPTSTPTHLTGSDPVSRTSGTRPCARLHQEIAPAPTARTRWDNRWHAGRRCEGSPPIAAAAGLPFEAGRAVFGGATERTGPFTDEATRRGGEGARRDLRAEVRYASARGRRNRVPDRARRFPLPVAIAMVRAAGAMDISPGYGEFDTQGKLRSARSSRVLSCHANSSARGRDAHRYEPPTSRVTPSL